jgi:hypothetical protein
VSRLDDVKEDLAVALKMIDLAWSPGEAQACMTRAVVTMLGSIATTFAMMYDLDQTQVRKEGR